MESQYTESIAKVILFDPIDSGANRLCILSSHATPSMASWLLTTYEEQGITGISIELIIEAVMDNGIDSISHEGFKELHRRRILISVAFPATICSSRQHPKVICLFGFRMICPSRRLTVLMILCKPRF